MLLLYAPVVKDLLELHSVLLLRIPFTHAKRTLRHEHQHTFHILQVLWSVRDLQG